MPNFTTTNLTQISRKGDGTVVGQSATDLVSFYGATPVVQQAFVAAATDATTQTAAVVAIRTALINLGLMASS